MSYRKLHLAGVAIIALAMAGAAAPIPSSIHQAYAQRRQPPQQLVVSFKQDIVPIFRGYCYSCHEPGGEGYKASGLDLTSYAGVMKGTKFGRMVIPGKPDISNLVVLIEGRAAAKIRMPHGRKQLPSCLRNEIWTWVFQGAKDN